MSTVDKHIASLLQEHDCVIIPGFGGLISQYSPVRIHPVRHSMAPPAKKIAFNEKLQLNDGRLIGHISFKEHLSEADATTRVQAFVTSVNLALDQHQRYLLQDIGLFRKEHGRPVEFEYEEKINLLADSFGLPEVFSKPVQRHRSLAEIRTVVQERVVIPAGGAQKDGKQVSLWRRTLRYAAMLPIVMLSATALFLASTLENGLDLGNLNPLSLIGESSKNWFVSEKQLATTSGNTAEWSLESRRAFYSALIVSPEAERTVYLNDAFIAQYEVAEVAQAEASDWETAPSTEEAAPEAALPISKEEAVAIETAQLKKPAVAVAAPAENKAADVHVTEQTGRFYIIAGGFTEVANAKHLHRLATKNGLQAKILLAGKGSRLNRVSLADFENRNEAIAQLSDLTKTYGKALWVLEY